MCATSPFTAVPSRLLQKRVLRIWCRYCCTKTAATIIKLIPLTLVIIIFFIFFVMTSGLGPREHFVSRADLVLRHEKNTAGIFPLSSSAGLQQGVISSFSRTCHLINFSSSHSFSRYIPLCHQCELMQVSEAGWKKKRRKLRRHRLNCFAPQPRIV